MFKKWALPGNDIFQFLVSLIYAVFSLSAVQTSFKHITTFPISKIGSFFQHHLTMSKMKVRNELVIKIFQKTEKPVFFSSHFSLRNCISKTKSIIWFSFHSLQGTFVGINAVVVMTNVPLS